MVISFFSPALLKLKLSVVVSIEITELSIVSVPMLALLSTLKENNTTAKVTVRLKSAVKIIRIKLKKAL